MMEMTKIDVGGWSTLGASIVGGLAWLFKINNKANNNAEKISKGAEKLDLIEKEVDSAISKNYQTSQAIISLSNNIDNLVEELRANTERMNTFIEQTIRNDENIKNILKK